MKNTNAINTAYLSLARQLREATVRSDERARATHGRFNVFTTLLKAKDEERLHTPFLHNLLDPSGNHDCGDVFLNLFFEMLDEFSPIDHEGKPTPLPIGLKTRKWQAHREYSCDKGELDIFIDSGDVGIVIENKIFAYEGTKQLARYSEFLTQRYQSKENRVLLYLTRFGAPSSTHEGDSYLRISYEDHILPWLEKCLQTTYNAIPVNQALIQYRNVVRQILDLPADPEIMEDATAFVRQNPDVIRFHQIINDAAEKVRLDFIQEIATGVGNRLSKNFTVSLCGDSHKVGTKDESTFYLAPKNVEHPLSGARFHLAFEYWATGGKAKVSHGEWLFGIDAGNPIPDDIRPIYDRMLMLIRKRGPGESYQEPSPNAPAWPLGWWELMPELTDELLASEIARPDLSQPERICSKIEDLIQLLIEVYQEASASLPNIAAS